MGSEMCIRDRYGMIVPFIGLGMYAGFQRPAMMVTIAASYAAMMLPMQSGITLYLQKRRLPEAVRPGSLAVNFLRLIFVVQLILAGCVIYFTVL